MPKVNIPRVGVVNFPDTMSQEDILQAIETDILPNYQRPEYGVLESFGRGVSRGAKRLGSTFGDVIPAAVGSALGFEDYAKRQLEEAAQTEREIQAENAPGFTSYKQIEGPGDFLKYAAETIGETTPDIASILVPGGVGGALAKRGVLGAAEELAAAEAKRLALPGGLAAEQAGKFIGEKAAEAGARGQAAGVYLGSFAVNTPDVFQSIYEQTGELAPGASLLFGSAVAALDAVLPQQLLKGLSQTEKLTIGEKILERSGMKPGLLRKAAAIIPETAAKEGITEGAQELITAAAEKFVDENQDLWSSENFNRYLESAVRGAVAGGGFGTVQAGGEGLRARYEERQKQQAEAAARQAEAERQQRLATGEAEQLSLVSPQEAPVPTLPEGQEKYGQTQYVGGFDKAMLEAQKRGYFPGRYELDTSLPAEAEEFTKPPKMAQTRYAGELTEEERRAGLGAFEPEPSAIEGQGELFGKPKKGEALPPSKQVLESFKTAQAEIERRAKLVPENTPLGKLVNKAREELDALGQRIETASQKEVLDSLTALPKNLVSLATRTKIEKAAKSAPVEVVPVEAAPESVLTAERLKETGLSPRAGIFKRLVGKDLVENVDEVRAEIDKAAANPNLSESTIKALEQLQTRLPAVEEPTAPTTEEAVVEEKPTVEEPPMSYEERVAAADALEKIDAELSEAKDAWNSQFPDEKILRGKDAEELLDRVANGELPELNNPKALVQLNKLADLAAQENKAAATVTKAANQVMAEQDKQKAAAPAPTLPAGKLDLGTPQEVWDDMDTGVPYTELSKANKDIWEQSLGRPNTQQIADNIARSHKRNVREEQRAKIEPEEPIEEGPFAGEQEAAEIDNTAAINNYIEQNLTEEERALVQNDKQLGNGSYDAGVEKLKKYVAQALAEKLPASIKKVVRDLVNKIKQGMMAFMVAINMTPQMPVDLVSVPLSRTEAYAYAQKVDTRGQAVAPMAERVANFALNEGNGRAFVVVDKQNATLYAYSSNGVLLDKTPVVMGITVGDVRPKLGLHPSKMPTEARITPAGQFTGQFTANQMYGSVVMLGETVEPGVGAVAIHRIYLGNANERRMDRLQSPTPTDNRIGQGCINVPDTFYDGVIAPNFQGQSQIYVMPDLEDAVDYFGIKDKDIKVTGGTRTKQKNTAQETVANKEEDEVATAKARVGEALDRLVASIGAKANLTPEEQGSLGDFMAALGQLMYVLIKSGARSFKQALPIARRRAKEKLGDNAKHVPDAEYKKAFDEAKARFDKEGKANTTETRKVLQEAITNLGQRIQNLPPATQPLLNGALEVTSNMPDNLRRAVLSFLSLDQIYEMYGNIVPSLKNLIQALEVRASDAMFRRETVDKNVVRWYKLSKNYTPEQLQKFFDVANNTTLDQVDPLTITYVRDPKTGEFVRKYNLSPEPTLANNPIVQEFYKQPKELQQAYLELRQEYDKYGDELQNLILKNLSGSAASKMRAEFESKRLKVYLPLWREGGYWLAYTDKNGEPVSRSFNSVKERNDAIAQIKSQGIKDYDEFSRLEQIPHTHRGVPPTGFVANIIGTMKQQGVPDSVLDQVYQSYLSLFPAESVRQMFRTREGRLGFEEDVFQAYANVGTRMANQLSRLNNAQPIDEAMNAVRQEADTNRTQVAKDVFANILAQNDFLNDPTPTAWASNLSTFSYFWYIAGNISSALINLTQLPIVVYSVLGGEYGFDTAFEAMKNASSTYFNGGLDDNSSIMPDFTFGKNKNLSAAHKRLYEEAVRRSVIRRSTGYELTDMRRHNVQDYTGTWAKVQKGLGWMFQNSERMNREVTLLAAFDLEFKRSGDINKAIEKAIDVTKTSHGAALAETGPRIFQNGIGKVAFTFKRFAQSQLYLQQKLFRQAFGKADPEIKDLARRQLAGIYGMAFMFAGAQGLPLYGAASVLASMLFGDDDDPIDVDEYVRKAVGDTVYKGPLNQMFNIDIASRTGFNNLVWRDNPRRLAEVGPTSYMLEQFAGPAYSAFINMGRAKELFGQGQTFKGLEAMTPSFVRNGIKGIRFGIEGALNKDGVPIVDDVNAYNVMMQAIGFAPADLSEAYARAGAMKRVEKGVMDRRVALLSRLNMARDERDFDGIREVRESIREFNSKHRQHGVRIESDTMSKSYSTHKQRTREMVDGVHLNKYMKKELIDTYGED